MAPFSPCPAIYAPEAGISAAVNESRRLERIKERNAWLSAEALCFAAVMESVSKDESACALLFNLEQRTRTQAVALAVANGNQPPENHDHVMTTVNCLTELDITHNTISTSTLELKEELLKELKITAGEPVRSYLTRLDLAQGAVEAHGGLLSLPRKEGKLSSGLLNGEATLGYLAQGLTMSTQSYADKLNLLRAYDTTAAGIERLSKSKLRGPRGVAFQVIGDPKGKPTPCSSCGLLYHTEDKCWKKYPHLKPSPAELKKRADARKANQKRKRGGGPDNPKGKDDKPKPAKNPRLTFPAPGDSAAHQSVSMVTDVDEVMNVEPACAMPDRLFLDSCCSTGIWLMFTKRYFEKLRRIDTHVGTASNDGQLKIQGVGDIAGQQHVYYCPDARRNLISQGRIHRLGMTYLAKPDTPPVLMDSQMNILLYGEYDRAMPHFSVDDFVQLLLNLSSGGVINYVEQSLVFRERPLSIELWHARLGHVNRERVVAMFKLRTAQGIVLPRAELSGKKLAETNLPCRVCRLTKGHRAHFGARVTTNNINYAGEMIVADIHIFMNCPSREGFKYAVNFTDVASTKTWSYLTITKATFLECAKKLQLEELQPKGIIWKKFHSDSDPVILSNESREWFTSQGILQTSSPTDTPEMNSMAEAANKILGHLCLSQLTNASAESTLWGGLISCG